MLLLTSLSLAPVSLDTGAFCDYNANKVTGVWSRRSLLNIVLLERGADVNHGRFFFLAYFLTILMMLTTSVATAQSSCLLRARTREYSRLRWGLCLLQELKPSAVLAAAHFAGHLRS